MNSYVVLILIVAVQLFIIGGIAISLDRWIKKQPDKLVAKHHALSVAFRVFIVLLIGNVILDIFTYISDHELRSSSLAILILALALLSLSKKRFARRIEQRQQIQAEQDAAANP